MRGFIRFLQADEISGYLAENVLLHDSARPRTVRQTQALLRKEFHWDIFEHPLYRLDLAQSYFFQFSKMKEHSACRPNRFSCEDLKDAG